MPLVKGGKIATDVFVHVADDAEIPVDGGILISAARFLGDAEALSGRAGKTGVIWPNNRDIDDLVPWLDRLAVVALVFPSFRDGRAYSQARVLRERHGYRGELRATGNVLPDQLQFMLQVGFDTFDIGERFTLATWQQASKLMSLAYQRGLYRRNDEAEIWTERHTDAEPWLEQPHAG